MTHINKLLTLTHFQSHKIIIIDTYKYLLIPTVNLYFYITTIHLLTILPVFLCFTIFTCLCYLVIVIVINRLSLQAEITM